MVAHWKLDDGSPSTTAADETGVNHGTLSGGPTWIAGQVGTGALSFDHMDDHVDCGNNASINITGTAMTITAWIKPAAYYTPGNWILGKMANSTGSYGLFLNVSGFLVLGLDSGSGWADSNPSSNPVPLNQWHHVAATYDGSMVRYYIDGQPAGAVSRPGSIVAKSHNLMIGRESGWNSQRWHGSLDEISLWNEVLDGTAILDIYNSGVSFPAQLTINSNPAAVSTVSPYVNETQGQAIGNPISISAYPMADCLIDTKYIFDHWDINSNAQIADINDATTTVTILLPGDAQITAHYTTAPTTYIDCGAFDASNLNYVIVSPQGPDGGGSFGPNTRGTQTAGMAEALAYALANGKEVFIVGGPDVTYSLEKTLVVPPAENLHIDGGNYVMNFTQTTGNCLVIDSAINCDYKFGDVQAPNLLNGSLVRVWPQNPNPDGQVSFEKNILKLGILTGPDSTSSVTGIELGGSIGNEIFINSIAKCGTGLLVTSGEADSIECPHIKNCAAMLQVDNSNGMQITCSFDPAGMVGSPIGANLSGGNNTIYHLTYLAGFDPGNAIVLGHNLQDTLIYAMDLPADGITNNANVQTNRIVATNSVGFNITTPGVAASGAYTDNNTAFTVVVLILTEGSVSSWSIKDSDGNIAVMAAGLYAGQSIFLDPGDSIKFNYSNAPTWAWRVLK